MPLTRTAAPGNGPDEPHADRVHLEVTRDTNGPGQTARRESLPEWRAQSGVGRGFLEPANAAFVAKAVGLSCDTFDVSEACMSWVRSLQLAYNLLAMRSYRDILVVNAEFNVYEHGIPNIFAICSPDRLKYSFAALTVGEAATATVLASSPKKWKFRFRSAPELAPLCNLPLPGFEEFCGADVRLGLNGTHQLVSFGSELSKAAVRQMIAFVNDTYANVDGIDLWLPHAASEANFRLIARKVGVGERLYTKVFRRYGNLISASIPAAIVMAQQDGMLRRGNGSSCAPPLQAWHSDSGMLMTSRRDDTGCLCLCHRSGRARHRRDPR